MDSDQGDADRRHASATGPTDELEPIDDSVFDGPPPTIRQKVGGNTAAAIASAAMLGIGEVLEPEKTRAKVEIVNEAPDDQPIIDLDFGDLPDLGT